MSITKIPKLIKMGKEGLKGDLKRLAEIKKEFEKYIKVKPSDKFGKTTVVYPKGKKAVDARELTERFKDEMFDIYKRINEKLSKK
tara:strand:- start:625 stop:879 length:255 start_codon:yes stop_codon:yes gene_type:complete